MIKREDIQIRDPYVFVCKDQYILLGSTDKNCWRGPASGFDAFISNDLESFEPAGTLFSRTDSFWATENFWAPELHEYNGKYYLFASFFTPGRLRATSILRADTPLGPFAPWGEDQVTPREWMSLDGTLYVDDDNQPWIVFCHEWLQPGGGTVCARKLKRDLSGADGDPVTLFAASDAKWTKEVTHSSGVKGFVTDGPFIAPNDSPDDHSLSMLWSSHTPTGYGIGIAVSESGNILGSWKQQDKPLYAKDGGHGMVFTDLNGVRRLAIHTPNDTPNERPIFPAFDPLVNIL